jgi:hypothetical protein
LAKERSNSSFHVSSHESFFSFIKTKVDFDLNLNLDLDLAKEGEYYNGGRGSNFYTPRWSMDYLEELTTLFINGGWNDLDINVCS